MSASRRPLTPSHKVTPVTPKRENSGQLQRFLTAYATRHLQAALLSLGQISRVPWTTFMVCLVMGIALALPSGLFTVFKNIRALDHYWGDRSPVVLYLKMPTSDSEALSLAKKIETQPAVEKVAYISPMAGLAEFQKQADFGNALNSLKENPLPGVLVVTPKPEAQTPEALTTLRDSLKALPQVEMAKLDLDWVQRLNALLTVAGKLGFALSVILCLGVILIVGSTINLALQTHRDEIEVYKLVGATDSFIRRPFLYRGIIYGIIGSLLAWLIVIITLAWLNNSIAVVAKLYGSDFALQGLGFQGGISLIVLGIILGWLGAWIAVYRYGVRSI